MKADKLALIVDDEADMADYLARVVGMAGFHTSVAHSSAELFALKAQFPSFDIVILDLMLPDKDGIELLRELAEDSCPSPVILISGHDDKVLDSARHVAEARGLTVVGVLTKPIRPPELMVLLRTLPDASPYRHQMPPTVDISAEALRQALDRDELEVFLQPQVSLKNGRWIGMEALVRWRHPQAGLLGAYAFVPEMEACGLVMDMTLLVAAKAMKTLKNCVEKFAYDGIIAINLAPSSLTDLHFPERMLEAAKAGGCDPKQIFFEITETSIPRDPAMAMDILTRLRLKGFKLSIDDFGTGYSTMTSLRSQPISEIKLDLSFIQPALHDRTARMIVIQSLALGKELGLQVMAEGVETEAHWCWLKEAGCDAAQGYFIAKPMPEAELGSWYRNWCKNTTARLHHVEFSKHNVVTHSPRDMRLLVVDDEEAMRDLLANYLTMDGYVVQVADCVDQAWRILNENGSRFDAVISDRLMPGGDGLELVKKIKNDERLKAIPVIIQSAMSAEQDFQEGIEVGAHFYLTKPYQRQLLLAVVYAAIEDGHRRRTLNEECVRWNRSLDLLCEGEFRVRTLTEANNLAARLATLCDHKDEAAKGFSELLINAIEHGNLGIGYEEKGALLESGCWYGELERRLACPDQQERYAYVKFKLKNERFQVSICDQGNGFPYQNFQTFDPARATHAHGRGIAMAKLAGFESVDYQGCGNEVVVTARVKAMD